MDELGLFSAALGLTGPWRVTRSEFDAERSQLDLYLDFDSGKKRIVVARFVHNDRLIDALMTRAFSALNASPGARTYYDQLKARGTEHNAALRHLANRLVGILHGCLKTRTCYDEATAWSHHVEKTAA